jgi:hypothetical protein
MSLQKRIFAVLICNTTSTNISCAIWRINLSKLIRNLIGDRCYDMEAKHKIPFAITRQFGAPVDYDVLSRSGVLETEHSFLSVYQYLFHRYFACLGAPLASDRQTETSPEARSVQR